jgi:RimJ/RimL family protein N-acetyltransferase
MKSDGMNQNLFSGRLVRLAALNAETDAEFFARRDRDTEYMRLLDSGPSQLANTQKVKEAIEQELREHEHDGVQFTIRTLADNQLIGFVAFDGIDWQHGETFVAIGIAEPDYRGKGYGTDAMQLALCYAFSELNLQRVSLDVFEYNPRAIRSYEKAGFVVEGRQRAALRRDGRYWDLIYMGILRDEWEKRTTHDG